MGPGKVRLSCRALAEQAGRCQMKWARMWVGGSSQAEEKGKEATACRAAAETMRGHKAPEQTEAGAAPTGTSFVLPTAGVQ